MAWSTDAEAVWTMCRADMPAVAARPGQTDEQAIRFAADSFVQTCRFEDVEPPTSDEVEARLRRP